MIEVCLYSKSDCSLCTPFMAVFEKLMLDPKWSRHIHLKKIDIDKDPVAFTKYHDKIPVAEINGRLAFKFRVDVLDLKKKLMQEITTR